MKRNVFYAQSGGVTPVINATAAGLIDYLKKNKSSFKSFYVWGDVGRGKTVILKSFIKNLDLKVIDFHYIEFMQSLSLIHI